MLPCRHHTSARTAALCYAARRWPHELKAPSMHIPPLSTIATTADRDQAEAALIRDGAVAFPAVFPDDRIGALRDGLEAAVQIGSASCRARVGQYVKIWVVAVALKKTNTKTYRI